MKMFIFGLVVGVALTLIVAMLILPKKMFLVDESKYSFDETVERIEKSVTENNWSMPNQYDLQATLKKHGFEVNPVKVFSVCKPSIANEILMGNDERYVSALMPCRIAVYEKKDGTVYISRMNAGLVAKVLGKKINIAMGVASSENELILAAVIK